MNRPLVFLLFLLLATVVGCQGKPRYTNVKGTVTFNGKPIDKGEIFFTVEGQTPSSMDIVDGKYTGQAMVGSNRVSVSARKKSGSAPKLPPAAQAQIKGYKEWMRGKGQGGDPPA